MNGSEIIKMRQIEIEQLNQEINNIIQEINELQEIKADRFARLEDCQRTINFLRSKGY